MAYQNILFAGIGRIRDQLKLVSVFDRITSQEKSEIDNSFQGFLENAITRFSPGSREKHSFAQGVFYLLADRELSCVYALAVKSKSYPERVAYAFLAEFISTVSQSPDGRTLLSASQSDELTKIFRKPLKELMDKYDNPGSVDKTAQVQGKVDQVKGIMQENISKVIATHANLQELETKTDTLNMNAQDFSEAATQLKRKMWWKKMKITIVLAIIGLGVLAYIIVMIVNYIRKRNNP